MAEIGKIAPFERVNKVERESGADPRPARNAKVDEVAKLYEKQFLGEMVKAMRGSNSISGEKMSMGESIYREQLDGQYVDSWGENGGIGLADLIYQQLMERYFSGPGKNLKGPDGFKVTDREINRIGRLPTGPGTANQVPLKIEVKPSPDGSPGRIEAPFAGTLMSTSVLDGKTRVTLGHKDGLKSTFIFEGVIPAGLEPGKVLEKGEVVGILSPEARSFFMNLNQPPPK